MFLCIEFDANKIYDALVEENPGSMGGRPLSIGGVSEFSHHIFHLFVSFSTGINH